MNTDRIYLGSFVLMVAGVLGLCYGRFWLTVALMASAFVVQDLAKKEG